MTSTHTMCPKYSKAYHFADDTNVTLSDHLQETLLAKRMNHDLRKLSMWLRENKLSLYIARRKNRTCSVLKTKYKTK